MGTVNLTDIHALALGSVALVLIHTYILVKSLGVSRIVGKWKRTWK